MSAPVLEIANLSIWLDTTTGRRQVVDNISFSIEAGDTTGLVGESGCGKTMTALAILGLLPASNTHMRCSFIKVKGRDMLGLDGQQRRQVLGHDIAMVFQQPGTALDPVFTIGQQISSVYRRHIGGSRESANRATLKSLEQTGFDHPEEIVRTYPHQLSGGMKQLAMIAMASICHPAVLIADEPTTALDNTTQALIIKQLQRLRTAHGTAILLISHDLAVIRSLCREVLVMYCGRLLEKTDCTRLFSTPRHPYSAGLISCIPIISPQRPGSINTIPGQVPVSTDLPTGCHFSPRCDRTVDRCQQSVPQFETDGDHQVACFRPLP
jgi:oligopeptide/dipeptide ABC transporter ATP-binding protein